MVIGKPIPHGEAGGNSTMKGECCEWMFRLLPALEHFKSKETIRSIIELKSLAEAVRHKSGFPVVQVVAFNRIK